MPSNLILLSSFALSGYGTFRPDETWKSVYWKRSNGECPWYGDECHPQSESVVSGSMVYVLFRLWKPVMSELNPTTPFPSVRVWGALGCVGPVG